MKSFRTSITFTSKEDKAFLTKYFKEVGAIDPLSKEKEAELARKIHNGDEGAREILVKANVKFMASIAKKYLNNGLSLEDLVSEGYIGLWKAASKYDETKGYKFISYAVWWIRESILKALAENGRTIRLPANQIELIGKIDKTIQDFEFEHGRRPADDEIADILDIATNKVSRAINASDRGRSLDTSFSEDDDRTIADTIDVADDVDPDKEMMDESLRKELNSILSNIRPSEQYVVERLFGIGCQKMSIDDLAADLGMTREDVQLEKERGVIHLKKRTNNKILKHFLDKH